MNFNHIDMDTGIYKITNLISNKIYIGSTTTSFKRRFKEHLSALKRGDHPNSHMQRAFNLDGENSFIFEIIEIVEKENCILREQY